MVFTSPSLDPCRNLAAEEYFLHTITEPTLYLWQNENTIVVGRHQNPFRELDVTRFLSDGGKIVRRLSGGGTVFHDRGNLNFTFLFPPTQYDTDKTTAVLLRAMHALSIPAERTGRNDLTAEGRKFSGNAFCVRKDGAYHHGTLLLDADTERMRRYLTVDPRKLESKGVKSVASRVVNLIEYRPDLTIEDLKDALMDAFLTSFGGESTMHSIDTLPDASLAPLEAKYASWDWTFGETPDFAVQFSARFPWGSILLNLSSEDGRITGVHLETDAMDPTLGERIPAVLQGIPYDAVSVRTTLVQAGYPDIGQWLEEKI